MLQDIKLHNMACDRRDSKASGNEDDMGTVGVEEGECSSSESGNSNGSLSETSPSGLIPTSASSGSTSTTDSNPEIRGKHRPAPGGFWIHRRPADERRAKERDESRRRPVYPKTLARNRTTPPWRKRREPSPTPLPCTILIGRLSRNVTRAHVLEIFQTYGTIRSLEFPLDRLHPNIGQGYAYIQYETPDEAVNAMRHMDGGQIDGQEVTASPVLLPMPHPYAFAPQCSSAPLIRRPLPRWGRSPQRYRRSSPHSCRRTPRQHRQVTRTRSPARRQRYNRSSSSNSD